MAALLSLLGGFFKFSRAEEKPRSDDHENVLATLLETETEYHSDGHVSDSSHSSHEQTFAEKETDGDVCQYKTGMVTSITPNYGLIDNNMYFDLQNAGVDNLRLGQKVLFLAYRRRSTDEWRVRKIISVHDDMWDEDQAKEEPSQVRGAITRTIVGQVTGRQGRKVFVEPDIKFSLDDVKADFLPVAGDWVQIEALVEVDSSVTDFGGEILTVDRIRPLRSTLFTGVVTNWDSSRGEGSVNKNIYANIDACEAGFLPCEQDNVAVQAIESTQGQYVWRAVTVVPLLDAKAATSEKEKESENSNKTELQLLMDDKNGVVITGDISFGVLKPGEEKTVLVEVLNKGHVKQVLLRSRFYSKRKESQMTLVHPGINDTFVMHPGRKLVYNFTCKAKIPGQSSELFVFMFKSFKIGRFLKVIVEDPQLTAYLASEKLGAVCGRYKRENLVDRMQALKKKDHVVPGVRPVKPPAFVPVRMGLFMIPNRLWDEVLVSNQVGSLKSVVENIKNVVPCLNADMEFSNYGDYFHTLLYFEEIENNLQMRKFDLASAKFSLAGPGGEYLSLEVPGLVEKRPSLIVGDKITAVPASDDQQESGVKYEGYIHKVLCNEVWLKFNANFHANCYDKEYAISFHFSRSPMRRCHNAVNLAIKNLGSYVLFPNFVKIQEAQVYFKEVEVKEAGPPCDRENAGEDVITERSMRDGTLKVEVTLKWFNPDLNDLQKEAVRNILRGEARPLPYVIFGPPGTGKTVTLVETILQILFLIPKSRILVATPANSSANLLTERLLDSGLLLPGDLVRLVGYHCIDEGTIPEHLLPYCTTGDIRIRDKRAFVPAESQNMKISSNAKTLGRHRITVGTCIALGQLFIMGFPKGHFTHVIVDEAGQATEPEVLIPLGFLHARWGQCILAGDPLQLGPVIDSRIARNFGLGKSYLARLLESCLYKRDPVGFPGISGGYNPRLVTRLLMNYRSLPEILNLFSSLFYDNMLLPRASEDSHALLVSLSHMIPQRDTGGPPAVVFHGVRGTNYQTLDNPSWFNPQEIFQTMLYLKQLFAEGLTTDDVGVIAPYQKQVQRIRRLLEELELPIPKIGSVEEFQGQERKVILLSTVRSTEDFVKSDVRHSLGFIASSNRLNVAISRAQSLLIIMGNPHLLSRDPYWRSVLKYCIDRGSYKGCDLPFDLEELPLDFCSEQMLDTDAAPVAEGISDSNVFPHDYQLDEEEQ